MADVFDIDGVGGRFAMYAEPALPAASDAPLYDPTTYLDLIKIHSDLEYIQVAMEQSVTINHAFVAKPTVSWDWSTFNTQWKPKVYSNDRLLFTHNLGYIPFMIVSIGLVGAEPGAPVQINTTGGTRQVQVYATTTEIRMREDVDTGNGDLAAITLTYNVMVLRQAARLNVGVLFEADSDHVTAGEGWFDSNYHYLRAVAAGESPFKLTFSQNIDTEGGICRIIDTDGNIGHDFYVPGAYTGSLASITTQTVMR